MKCFYADANNRPQGPHDLNQLERFKAEGKLTDATLVIPVGGTTWKPLAEVLTSAKPLRSAPPPKVQPKRTAATTEFQSKERTSATCPTSCYGYDKTTLLVATICCTILCAVLISGALITFGVWGARHNVSVVTKTNGGRVPNYISAIEDVLKRDRALATTMQSKLSGATIEKDEDLDYRASVINEYVTATREIDLSKCPRDFAEQYWRHLGAWSGQVQTLASHPHIPSGGEAFLEGLFRGLAGDLTGGVFEKQAEFKAFAQRVQNHNSQVRETWQEVEALAIRYGVNLSR